MSGLATVEEKNEEGDDDNNDDDKVMVKRSACVWLSHGRGEGRRGQRRGDGKEIGLCLA